MIFTRNKRLFIYAVLIILVLYNAIAFVIPIEKNGNFWTGYLFTMLALLLSGGVCLYAFDKEGLQSKFYGWPLIIVLWNYLLIQMALGFVLLFVSSIPTWIGVIISCVLLSACLVGLIATEAGKGEIDRMDAEIQEKTFLIKSFQINIDSMIDKTGNPSIKKSLKDLSEVFRYSDPVSNPKLGSLENKIEAKINVLEESLGNASFEEAAMICEEIQRLMVERNKKCKLLK
jgi:hypothetical protein